MNPRIPLIAIIVVLGGFMAYELTKKRPAHDPNCKDCRPPITAPVVPPIVEEPPPVTPPIVEPPAPIKGKIYTYAEGLALAKTSNKNMLVVFGADWCGWCKKLEVTLKDSSVVAVTDNYINVHVDVDKEKDVTKKLRLSGGIPAYMMVDSQERVVKSGSGYKTVPQFQAWLKMAAIVEENDVEKTSTIDGNH
jgi:thiol-disulfide isomerase/thioredoxin